MSLQSLARTAFATVQALHPDSIVVIKSGTSTANAIRDTGTDDSEFSDRGETGNTSGTVRVDASLFPEPVRGSTITVDGKQVWVTEVKRDPVGALLTITFTKQQPLTVDL